MSILSDFEDRVANAVEGVFAGVFRAPVQPAELARACAKEMDRRRKLGVGKVYAPTMYSVLLSPEDGDQLGGFADTLAGELETYLVGYARQKGYDLATRPRVRFLVDDELKLGRYEVIGELLSAEEIATELGESSAASFSAPVSGPAPEPGPTAGVAGSSTAVFSEAAPVVSGAGSSAVPALLLPDDREVRLERERLVIGRLKACDICLQDKNASREHAVVEREGSGWVLQDLGSTNGTLVNDEPVSRVRLRDGDVITIGVSEILFRDARAT